VRRLAIWLVLVLPAAASGTARAEPLDSYDWMAVAPFVVAGEPVGDHGRLVEFRVDTVLRGGVQEGEVIRVNLRRANRARNYDADPQALRLDLGRAYVLLLEPAVPTRPDSYDLVRGTRGARELPAEGAAAHLEALRCFARVQDEQGHDEVWRELTRMIEATNPLEVDAALGQFLKFRRGEPQLLEKLLPLLDHPADSLRERVARLVGQILERHPERSAVPEEDLRNALAARARRDEVVAVRVAATDALGALAGDAVERILDEIARGDPEQEVRYAAERLIHDRQQGRGAAAGGDNDGN
jgi:hypothetical protein